MSDAISNRFTLLFVLASLAPGRALPQETDGAGLKANLDLPFTAAGGEEEDEVEAPEIVVFYGQAFEGDGVFFCCDRSGSMGGAKFRRLQDEVARSIAQFSERVQFGIVLFDAQVQKFPATGRPAGATPAMKGAAIAWVHSCRPGTASCYKEALLTALHFANQSSARRRILITLGDGMPWCPGYDSAHYAEETLAEVSRRNTLKVRINAICIGGVKTANEEWMRRLAAQNGGSYSRIVE